LKFILFDLFVLHQIRVLINITFNGLIKLGEYSGYSPEQLNDIKNKTKGKNAFVYFNNTAGEEGILNALEFKKNINR